MDSGSKTMLFGGALMCAGLQVTAAGAQVSDVTARFTGNVDNVIAYDTATNSYIDTGVNESFDVSGDASLLPFSRSAMGGFPGSFPYSYYPEQNVSVSGSGVPSATGELNFTGFASAYAGVFFPSAGNFDVNAALRREFTVERPSDFSINVLNFFFDNDTGFAGIELRDSSNNAVFEYFDVFFDPMATGTLDPGTYVLEVNAGGSGSARVNLNVIPAPAPAGLLACAGLLGVRRRR